MILSLNYFKRRINIHMLFQAFNYYDRKVHDNNAFKTHFKYFLKQIINNLNANTFPPEINEKHTPTLLICFSIDNSS